ncbi:LETM1-like protein [Plasmodium brasilianum]|uniref:LETM1-like protein, putative n=2 Tax=Plasmodium (Plasmodium) TaxID=418103 RepID=A0A1A8VM66_PLAMA|nr:LETM1-like protein, putative [Plasmodium malariae]KAI4840124.1 LETM1-like protein [Plasmodium brasilianum]SBS81418.1 LETM1-like protein, putative [Plasmodium malariae]SBT87486.1 LETM1-like protein, putative [Plasmodium malariae]
MGLRSIKVTYRFLSTRGHGDLKKKLYSYSKIIEASNANTVHYNDVNEERRKRLAWKLCSATAATTAAATTAAATTAAATTAAATTAAATSTAGTTASIASTWQNPLCLIDANLFSNRISHNYDKAAVRINKWILAKGKHFTINSIIKKSFSTKYQSAQTDKNIEQKKVKLDGSNIETRKELIMAEDQKGRTQKVPSPLNESWEHHKNSIMGNKTNHETNHETNHKTNHETNHKTNHETNQEAKNGINNMDSHVVSNANCSNSSNSAHDLENQGKGNEEHATMINMIKKKKLKTNDSENKINKICKKSASGLKYAFSIIKTTCAQIKIIILQPSMLRVYYGDLKKNVKHTIVWVKTGILLFLTNMKISKNLIIKRLKGYRLSYSEYKLLIRTMNDMFKLIPFSFFIIIPFAEFLLPLFLKIYPDLLPSTFKNNDDNFNKIKKNLYAKQQLAKFLQQLIEEKEKQLNENIGIDSDKKKKILNKFHQQLINKDEKDVNPFLSVADTLKIAKIFKDDFVLDQMNLKTLQTICHLLGLKPYGMHYHVVLQLRHHFLRLQREDRELIYEGVDNLKKNTLIEICKDRGMNYNITEKEMKIQIQQWLELASIKEVPYILLLYIRCVVITHAIMDIQDTDKTSCSLNNENITKSGNIDDKQKLIQEAKEKLDDLKMKELEIKKNINKETNEEVIENKENKIKMNFLKKNKYMQNELNMLRQICDLQHNELKIAFTSLTDLAEKRQSCDINEIIKNMSERLQHIEKHINELNAHKQVEMDEYFYPEEEKTDDVVSIKS